MKSIGRRQGRPTAATRDTLSAPLRFRQRQAGPPYRLRLEVGVRTDSGSTVVPVTLDDSATAIDIDTPGRPLEVRLDPGYRVLLWRPEYGARPGP